METGHWFGANSNDSAFVVNSNAAQQLPESTPHMIGVVQNLDGMFNQPEKAVRIRLANDYNYNWLCIRVLEVDIRRTVAYLSRQFSLPRHHTIVYYFDPHFEYWIHYQDRLNRLSDILAVISTLLSCSAMYGLRVSLVNDKLKEIALHKLFGARPLHITYLLSLIFIKQLLTALFVFAPVTYIVLKELLRVFVYATGFSWLDPVYPIAYCVCVVVAICGFQAMSLNRANVAGALKG